MPKMIHNVEETIFKTAEQLFSRKGYDNVDMKAIAKECNIAVGTLYNYYGSKKELFLKVFSISWEKTFFKIKNVSKVDDITRQIISILYYDIKERSGLGFNIFNSKSFTKEENEKINSKIVEEIKNIFDVNIISAKINTEKIIKIIIYNIVLLSNLYPDSDKDNIEILLNIFYSNIR